MDILCPHSSLEEMGGSEYVQKFDLYNVTKEEHQQCKVKSRFADQLYLINLLTSRQRHNDVRID